MTTYKFKLLPLLVAIVLLIALTTCAAPPSTVFPLGLTCPTLSLTVNNDPHLLVDSNNPAAGPHVTTAYATITNTGGATAYDVYMYVGNGVTPGTFTVGSDGQKLSMLGSVGDATRFIGNLAPGQSKTVFWMLTYPLTYGKTYPMTIWSSQVAGCSVDALHTYTTQSTISAQADKILGTVTIDPPSGIVSVGNILTVTVTGFNLGTIGSQGDAWFQPVGNIDFNPACFRLVKSEVYIHSIGTGPVIDKLYFTGLNNPPKYSYNATDYVKYYFVALGECTTTMKLYQEAASGNQEKYSADYGVAGASLTTTSQGGSVTLDKSVSPLSGGASTTFTWTITYTNNTDYPVGDPQNGNGLVIIDEAIPVNTTYVAGSSSCSGFSCLKYYSTDNGATWSQTEPVPASSVNKLKWSISQTIPAHSSGTVSFQSKVNSGVSGTPLICNSASAKIDDGALLASDTVCANAGVDLHLSKVVNQSTPCEDSNVTYTITVDNPSSEDATSVQVTDLLPTGLTYVSSVASQGSYSSMTGLWTVGTLSAGNSATLLLTATVNSGTGGQTITNTASITHADQPDPVISNNSAHADILVLSRPVAVADSNSPVCAGHTIQLYGGPSGMAYSWTGPNGFISSSQNPTIPGATTLNEGTYYLTVTAPNGCSDTASTTVTVQTCATPPDTPTNQSPGNATCVDLPVTLTASAFSDPGPLEYQIAAQWQIRASTGSYSDPVFDSGNDTVNLNSITIPAGILNDSSSYCWHVRYQGSLGAWSEYSSETCFYTRPVALAYSNTPVCVGGTIQLYGGPSGMVYNWTGPLGFTSDLQRPTIGSATLTMAGTYYLTVTDANGCSNTTSTYVTVQTCASPPNTPTNISPSPATCVGLPVTLTASAFSDPGSGEYQIAARWQIRAGGGGYSDPVFDSGNDTVNLNSITIPAGILSDASSYFWHVRYQDNLGAWSEYSSETLFFTNPVATASSNSPIYVVGIIQLYGGPTGMVYSWTGPNSFSSSLQNPTIPNAASAMAGTYTLTVTSSNGCTDDASIGVTINAKPAASPPYTIPPCMCRGLIISSTEGGSVTTPGVGEFSYPCDTVVDLVASPDPGYKFVNWSGDVDTIADIHDASTNITMCEWYSITANFEPEGSGYSLTISSTEGGSVTAPGEGTSIHTASTVVELVAQPSEGYQFMKWTGDVSTIADIYAASTTITMNADYSITANFQAISPIKYKLTLSGTTGGSVTSPGEGTFTYDEGTVVTLVATPDPGYRFTSWLGDVDTIANVNVASTTITMDANYFITGAFKFRAVGGCFIATAAYGTPTAEQIDMLREFRDAVLLESTTGSQFVALYYQLSPPVADCISGNELLRTLVRELLVDPIVWIVEATEAIWQN